MLEDLVLSAFSDALSRLKEKLKEEMSLFTGLNLPPGLLGL
jgi:DNA-binding protein YbaB